MIYSKSQIPAHLHNYFRPAEYGLEDSPAAYVETMRAVFAEVRRILADDGTLWLNLGDSYARQGGGGRGGGSMLQGRKHGHAQESSNLRRRKPGITLPEKNLLGIPWRVAFALQDDGWILRSDIIWHKPNAMPESVTDRPTTRHEHIFLFAKSSRYWFDSDAIQEPAVGAKAGNTTESLQRYGQNAQGEGGRRFGGNPSSTLSEVRTMRRSGDVWTIPTQPFAEAHYAVMAPALAKRCVLAGCKPGGTVLDPFSGSGTTGMVAVQTGRKYVGIELSADNLDLSLRTRFAQPALDFGGEAS